jgi:hypothetical protein
MWLRIIYDTLDNELVNFEPDKIEVEIIQSQVAPVGVEWKNFRLSPIFPLDLAIDIPAIDSQTLHFFSFKNAYRALARIQQVGSKELQKSTFFSLGLASVILITSKPSLYDELMQVVAIKPDMYEYWITKSGKINKIQYTSTPTTNEVSVSIISYSKLPLTERSIIDEFMVTIKLLLLKLTKHMPFEEPKIQRLIGEVNILVKELVYLNELTGDPPESLAEYSKEDLEGKKLNQNIRHQVVDRIVQINSALSYVSTQAFSGAVPILERRSLIRRHSLLGIGSAILALNNIARFIDDSFSPIVFDMTIAKSMQKYAPLQGMGNFPEYSTKEWSDSAIDEVPKATSSTASYLKLPYFSGRLGYRETEYSIAAAIQSISSGASLEWSLMTLTHEMLHGHVRTILNAVFYGSARSKSDQLREEYFNRYRQKLGKRLSDEKLLDSIRSLLFIYCCKVKTHGSLNLKRDEKGGLDIEMLPKDDLWKRLENEYRNISEIMVHVLDLHYFYGSRVSVYIPLIWSSWLTVPHVGGDVRQYILRSLLAIASKESGSEIDRFRRSTTLLAKLLNKYKNGKLNFPVIDNVLKILNDKTTLDSQYVYAFSNSLAIVDLASHIFFSKQVRGRIFNSDPFVEWVPAEKTEDGVEEEFRYKLPDDFNDEPIQSPLAYLFSKMIKELDNTISIEDLERETTIQFLALNSN